MKKNILFLCTGNSCRSQIAEAWGRTLRGESFNCYSAGTKKQALNIYAVRVMAEVGIDMSAYRSKTIDDLPAINMDFVFTVCSDAHENCPFFPGGKIIHRGFDDPPRLAKQISEESEVLAVYRRIRYEIKEFVENIESYMEDGV